MLTSVLELTLSHGICCVDEVQFMTDFRALEQFTSQPSLQGTSAAVVTQWKESI